MRTSWCVAALSAMALAGCGEGLDQDQVATTDQTLAPPAPPGPTEEQLATLGDSDCRVVAEAYLDAVRRGAFDFAERFWDDPVIDQERLSALFSGYVTPQIDIADVQEEGAAGSLYCTVTGALTDASDPRVAPRQGKIVLRRANDVPGATDQQLRWTIESSTFVEPMERSGRGEVA